jgi:hypothetical protein
LLVPGWSISCAAPDTKTKKISKSVIEHIFLEATIKHNWMGNLHNICGMGLLMVVVASVAHLESIC